jgi:hypothetical protein
MIDIASLHPDQFGVARQIFHSDNPAWLYWRPIDPLFWRSRLLSICNLTQDLRKLVAHVELDSQPMRPVYLGGGFTWKMP